MAHEPSVFFCDVKATVSPEQSASLCCPASISLIKHDGTCFQLDQQALPSFERRLFQHISRRPSPQKKNTKSRCNTNLHAFNRSCESPIHLKARMHIHPGILKSPWGSQSLGYPTVPPILGNCYALGLRHWALRLGLLIALLQLLPAPRSRCGTGTISGPLSHLSTESTGIYFKHMYGVCFFCPP